MHCAVCFALIFFCFLVPVTQMKLRTLNGFTSAPFRETAGSAFASLLGGSKKLRRIWEVKTKGKAV